MKIKIIAVLMGLAVLSGAFALGGAESGSSYTIEVGGSTSVTPLMELFAAEYAKTHPNIKVNINGTGSGDGITNAGVTYQIGMSSRELTPAEQGRGLTAVTVAIDGIAVIMNNTSPVNNLTMEQIRDIYTGAITDWSQISGGTKTGRIAVISREEGSGTRGAFEELVGFQGRLVRGANESTSTGAIKASVAQNVNAIGYISLGSVDNTVKAVSVNGVTPTNANVTNGTYKIARPFIVLTGRNVSSESKAFIDWMTSRAGQAIVRTSWIPVR
jgi:phosphate transport system substrate-binding protein